MMNYVAGVILYPYMTSGVRAAIVGNIAEGNGFADSFFQHLSTIKEVEFLGGDYEENEQISCPQNNVCIQRLHFLIQC